jgi:hypothetical protein
MESQMASIGTIAITLNTLCPADNHARLTLNLNSGEKIVILNEQVNDLIGPNITQDDVTSFLRILLELGLRGKTKAAAKSLLTGGVTVDIDAVPTP